MQEYMFNERLREIRSSRQMKQKDVVKLLGCSHNKYASWEQGRTEPDIESIRELCAIFSVSADELLGIGEN